MKKAETVTQLLVSVSNGNQEAYHKLFPIVYNKLKDIAMGQLQKEYAQKTLSCTELVHEVFLKLIDQTQIDYKDENHFYAIVARSMRQVLVDYARKKKAKKRGGDKKDLTLDEHSLNLRQHASQIIELNSLLEKLFKMDKRLGKVVELRFFAGLSIEETAEKLEVSTSTVNRDWAKARSWLHQHLQN